MVKLNPMRPVALIAVGSVLMIIGSVVGLVSGSHLLFVCMTGVVGVTCLAVAMYLYRQLSGPPKNHNRS
ncbi:membrane protein [Mycobacteroides franklinii]|nr:membrane protein [Mycobacteroides franklinii]